jgi:hypothetical protein
MKKSLLPYVLVALLFTGCSILMPKPKEFFQDKVHAVPEMKASEKETQRQTAKLAADKAKETWIAAVADDATPLVTLPAAQTVALTEAVSVSVGPPLSPSTLDPMVLAEKLNRAVAKLSTRLDEFKDENNVNAGKKIEGTGLFSVPYFVWIGGILFISFVGYTILKTVLKGLALTNPPIAVGMNVAGVAGRTAAKGFAQLLKGGEQFKQRIEEEISDPAVKAAVLRAFRSEHQKAADDDVKNVVEQLTKTP